MMFSVESLFHKVEYTGRTKNELTNTINSSIGIENFYKKVVCRTFQLSKKIFNDKLSQLLQTTPDIMDLKGMEKICHYRESILSRVLINNKK